MAYKIKLFVLGSVSTNCYLLYQEDTRKAVLFDPADRADVILDFINEKQLKLEAILLTHGHFDHIGAAQEIAKQCQAAIYGHELEAEIVSDTTLNLSAIMGRTAISLQLDKTLRDGDEIDAAGFHFQALHTPGHTPGGVCYYLEKEKLLFCGDTLFAGSVGRSDFPKGSYAELIRSIREKLLQLPGETQAFPGHGEQTTIGYEQTHNPFI